MKEIEEKIQTLITDAALNFEQFSSYAEDR